MKKITYEQLIEISEKEKTMNLKDVSSVIEDLSRGKDEEYGEFGEYDYEKDSRKKMKNLAEIISDNTITIFGDADRYHNLAVDYSRVNLLECAIQVLKRGLLKFSFSSDLLADLVLYGKESGQLEECQEALKSLQRVNKSSWGWRAYAFTIDYYLDVLMKLPNGDERRRLRQKIEDLSDEFIGFSLRDNTASDRAYCQKAEVIKAIGGKENQEKYLREGCKLNPLSPQCSLHLADILYERGEFNEALELLTRCKLAINKPQPDINPAYVYLLYAMTKTSQLIMGTPDGNFSGKESEIDDIYKDFHTALSSYSIDGSYEKAAKETLKMLEIQTQHKDKTHIPDDDDAY